MTTASASAAPLTPCSTRRELKRPSDFEQFMGSKVELRLYQPLDGSKSFVGTLCGYDNGDVTINIAGAEKRFEGQKLAQVRLRAEI